MFFCRLNNNLYEMESMLQKNQLKPSGEQGKGIYSGCKKSERKPYFSTEEPTLRVGVWPIWVGPAHSPLGQSILYTSSPTYSNMSSF